MVQVNNKEGMVFCDCGNEGIQVQYIPEEDEAYLSIWEFSNKDSKTTWKHKWEFIKNILKTGVPYGDQIILDRTGREYLIQILQAQNKKEVTCTTTSTGDIE